MSPAKLLAAMCVSVLAACGSQAPDDERINVLLVTLDTTRADRLGCYGNARIATPNLDRLAREGILFERAFTPIPSTLPSHCSIMTGLYPAQHGVHDNGVYELDEGVTTLAEQLKGAGYRTGAFVSAFVLDRQFGLAQGFDEYDDEVEEPLTADDPARLAHDPSLQPESRRWLVQLASPFQRRADAVSGAAIRWLRDSKKEPFFLWVHYFDPHASYTPPSPWDESYDQGYAGKLDGSRETFARVFAEQGWKTVSDIPRADMEHMIARYDGEIAYMDTWIGELLKTIDEQTLVVVVADHGEGFGEHGQIWEHNSNVFDEVVHVPLIVRLPGGAHGGQRVRRLVRTLDVAPTILELAGVRGELGDPSDSGRSLVPIFGAQDDALQPVEVLLEALRERQALQPRSSWLGLRTETHKLVLRFDEQGQPARRDLFDLSTSRDELIPTQAEFTERWTEDLVQRNDKMKATAGERSWRGMDQVTSDALRELGYVK